MLAFEVYTNGRKRFTAGGDYSTLTSALTLIRTKLPEPDDATILFSTSGIKPGEMVTIGSWPAEDLKVGDRIEIRIVEASEADEPESVEKHERADENDNA